MLPSKCQKPRPPTSAIFCQNHEKSQLHSTWLACYMNQTQEYHIITQSHTSSGTNPIIIWWTMWLQRQARISKDVLTADEYLRAEAPHAQNLRGQTREPSTSHHHRGDLHSPPETLDPPSYQCGSKTASGEGTDNNYITTSTSSPGGPWGGRSAWRSGSHRRWWDSCYSGRGKRPLATASWWTWFWRRWWCRLNMIQHLNDADFVGMHALLGLILPLGMIRPTCSSFALGCIAFWYDYRTILQDFHSPHCSSIVAVYRGQGLLPSKCC